MEGASKLLSLEVVLIMPLASTSSLIFDSLETSTALLLDSCCAVVAVVVASAIIISFPIVIIQSLDRTMAGG